MSKENENSVASKSSSKDTSKANQNSNSNHKTSNNDRKSVLEEKHQNEDVNMDNLSFCSDDTVEMVAESNDYFFEDENIVENERLLLTEPKYHKTFRVLHTRINLSRPNNDANVNTLGADKNDAEKSKKEAGSY